MNLMHFVGCSDTAPSKIFSHNFIHNREMKIYSFQTNAGCHSFNKRFLLPIIKELHVKVVKLKNNGITPWIFTILV